jgi:glycosyltransferase involved in cell wall biosynthesis
MKRVLITVHKFFPDHRSGTEVLAYKVAKELLSRGYEVLVVTANPPDTNAMYKEGPPISNYHFENIPVTVAEEALRLSGYIFTHEYFHPDIKETFVDILENFHPDIVHIFHAQNLSASIIEAAYEKSIPVVFSATDFWFICPIVQLIRPNGKLCRGPGPSALNCLTCYTPKLFPDKEQFIDAVNSKYPALSQKLDSLGSLGQLGYHASYVTYLASKLPNAIEATTERARYLPTIANSMQAIMVPTKLMQDLFIENGINPEIIHHVPFGIDTSELALHHKKTESKILRIAFIGTLLDHKGPDLLIEAFQKLPDNVNACLKIYGDTNQFPEYGSKLLKMSKQNFANSEKIEFCGTFANEKFGEIMSNIDVLVVPSRWYENTPLVIQSALATKTPLIVTDLGGLSELVKHEYNGLLFELNNAISLREQLLRLIMDDTLLKRLTANISPERTTKEMVNDIESIYKDVNKLKSSTSKI